MCWESEGEPGLAAQPFGFWKGRNCLPLEGAGNPEASLEAFLVLFIGANFAQLHPEVEKRFQGSWK